MKNNSNYGKIFLILFGIIISIFIAEVSLRTFNLFRDLAKGRLMARLSDNPIIGYELKPNYKHGEYVINSLGFRGRNFKLNKDKNIFRIVILGDSITFGSHLTEKDIYPSLLEKHLNSDKGLNRRFEVINAGFGGYNIWQYLEVYKEKVRRLNPDLVIVGVCQNDFEVSGPYYKDIFGIVRGDFESERQKGFLIRFELYKKISLRLKILLIMAKKGEKEDIIITSPPSLTKKWEEGSAPLKELIEIFDSENIAHIFLIFPYKFQPQGDDLFSDYRFIKFMRKNDINYLDLLDSFRNPKEELFVKGDIIHPNKLGHKIIADQIYKYLLKFRNLK